MWLKVGPHEFAFAVRFEFEPGSGAVRVHFADGKVARVLGETAIAIRAALETACLQPLVSVSLVG